MQCYVPFLIVAFILFAVGAIGVLVRRNFFVVLMSLEIMINSAGLVFVILSYFSGNISGQVFFIFVAAVAASETAVGLAIAVLMYRVRHTVDVTEFSIMKR